MKENVLLIIKLIILVSLPLIFILLFIGGLGFMDGFFTFELIGSVILIDIILWIVWGVIEHKNPEIVSKNILNKSVDEIVKIYSRNPKGFIMRSPESQPLRDIGQKLYDTGGMELMLQAHRMAVARGVNGRNLEACWDGIGGWAG